MNRGVDPTELVEQERYRFVDAQWPAIIAEELFWRVQEILLNNGRFAKPYKHVYRLTGLIHCGLCGELLVGKSATGRNSMYYYYGHNRKFRAVNDKHTERCRLERVPAIRLEEAAVGRLIELAGNKKLLAELARDSSKKAESSTDDFDKLIAAKEQERRRVQRLLDNLLMTLAERPEGLNTKAIHAKVNEFEVQLEQTAAELDGLKAERSGRGAQVINLESALKVFRQFSKGFEERPAHEQRDILKDVIHRITVTESMTHLNYYGSVREDVLDFGAEGSAFGPSENKEPDDPGSRGVVNTHRTLVRPAYQLVDSDPGPKSV